MKCFKKLFEKKAMPPLIIVLLLIVLVTTLYKSRKNITLVVDGQKREIVTYSSTVRKALEKEHINISPKDKIDKDINSKINDNDVIKIKRAVAVNVSVDGKDITVKSAEDDIQSMLKAEGIVLNANDKVKPDKKTKLFKNMNIKIARVKTKAITEEVPIDFKTVVKNDDSLPINKKKTIQEGKKGTKKIVKNVIYEDGQEVSRKLVSETVTTKPVDKVIAKGTKKDIAAASSNNQSISRGGSNSSCSRILRVKTTAYSSTNRFTASGRRAVRCPGGYSTVAVDPSVIPLGTRLYIDGYGHAIAADTGSAVKGHFIDLFFETNREARNWGIRHVNAYISR